MQTIDQSIHTISALRDMHQIYMDRGDAGRTLASMLREKLPTDDAPFILAIPAGGVPLGVWIASELKLPPADVDAIIVRKLKIPHNPEAGFGAIALSGEPIFNEPLLNRLNLSKEQVQKEIESVREQLRRRNEIFRQGRPLPDLTGRTAVIVDDGIASGYSMLAAVRGVRSLNPKRLCVAAATAPTRSARLVAAEADDVLVANLLDSESFAVAWAYRNWRDVPAEEAAAMLEDYRAGRPGPF
jgi:predicted phosphoribosyltransferase